MIRRAIKEKLHPRNRFRDGYDYPTLIARSPELAGFVAPNAYGDTSVDFANPAAVKALNQALLKDAYGLEAWDVPPGYLVPPVPGRSDYLHHLADLIGERLDAKPRRQSSIAVLDIGMGANAIYPLIGASEYGWRFVGSEIDCVALAWAQKIVANSPSVAHLIECRLQPSPIECFRGVVRVGETFDASMCNPPFHASAHDAAESTQRKQRRLGARATSRKTSVQNFGGKAGELWCDGGELGFIRRMIVQSARVPRQVRWFTTLVSKSANLPPLREALRNVRAVDVRVIDMSQGQKKSRILAWKF